MTTYEITGILHGKRYLYSTSEYWYAVKKFEANQLTSLWEISPNGKRTLIRRR